MRFVIASVLLVACHSSKPTQTASATTTVAARAADQSCHIVVNGCGCADGCARAEGRATAYWCFDEIGHGFPQPQGTSVPGRCFDVIEEDQVCGGKCAPTTAYFTCHAEGSSCAP